MAAAQKHGGGGGGGSSTTAGRAGGAGGAAPGSPGRTGTSTATATGSESPGGSQHLYKEGRKLNNQYFIITCDVVEDESRTDLLCYRAYDPRSHQEVSVTLGAEELAVVLTGDVRLLRTSEPAERARLHSKVIDSLGFEDRLLESQSESAEPSAAVPSPKRAAPPAAPGPPPLEEVRVVQAPAGGDRPQPAAAPTGTAVLREGRKIHGSYHIMSLKVFERGTATAPQPTITVDAYSPSTSTQFHKELVASDAVAAIQRSGSAALPVPSPFAELPDVIAAVAALGAVDLDPAADEDGGKRFYQACLDHVLHTMSSDIDAGMKSSALESAEAEKEQGNRAYLAKPRRLEEALKHYARAVSLVPASLVFRLNMAAALLELDRAKEAARECKAAVAQGRQLQAKVLAARQRVGGTAGAGGDGSADEGGEIETKLPEEDSASQLCGGQSPSTMIAKAYGRLGSCYQKLRLPQSAMNAWTLSLRETPNATIEQKLKTVVQVVSAQGAMNRAKALGKPPPSAPPAVPDIEDVLDRHAMLKASDDFKFQCTGCGECCRHADHIFLSPADIFNMSRAPGMEELRGVFDSHTLRDVFPDALKFTQKDGLPMCQLRPMMAKDGACHFSYPLYKAPDGHVLSYAEVRETSIEANERPVSPSEYNLTEEEERQAMEAVPGEASESDGASSDEESVASGGAAAASGGVAGSDSDSGASAKPEPEPVMNSYGRVALGCMFGMEKMPALCASYPMARELSWADFWHEHPVEKPAPAAVAPRARGGLVDTTDEAASPTADDGDDGDVPVDEGWKQQQFVVVKTDACEGFYEDGKERTTAFGNSATEAATQTITEFVERNELDKRWDNHDWFMRLVASVRRSGLAERAKKLDTGVHRELLQMLARVWYDFDTLPAARVRKFTSVARVRRVIQRQTRNVMEITDRFVRTEERRREAKAEEELQAAYAAGEAHREGAATPASAASSEGESSGAAGADKAESDPELVAAFKLALSGQGSAS